MFEMKNNEKNKSAVILSPEAGVKISGASVEAVVNDRAKTKRYSAKRDLYARSPNGSRLKMTEKTLSFLHLRGASEKQKESSLILRKAKFQAIFKFVLSSASGGAGGGKYNRISAFVSMPVLLIRISLEFFRVPRKNKDDLFFEASPKDSLHRHPERSEGSIKNNIKDWILRFANASLRMTFSALALIFTLATTTESLADESATAAEDTTQTQEAQKLLLNSGKCGKGCLYEITTDSTTGAQNLRVYNDPDYTGTTKNINASAFRGNGYINSDYHDNFYSNAVFDKIIIDGNFETIGNNAFTNTSANEVVFNGNIKNIGYGAFEGNNLTSINLPQGLKTIEGEAFYQNKINSVIIPDSVTSIGNWGFAYQKIGTVFVSDNLDVLGANGHVYQPFGSGFSLICKGDVEKCQSLVKEYQLTNSSTTTDLSDRVTGVDKDHCTGEKYFWNGTSCSRKETYCDKDMYYSGYECRMRPTDGSEITCDYEYSGWVKVGNNCYSPEVTYAKKHYTPAEANQWLRDGNDNFVVLTFKK